MKKILLILTLMLTCWQAASAYDFMVNGIAYDKNSDGNTVKVTYTNYEWNTLDFENYSGSQTITQANIPETVSNGGKTYTVTSIGDYAFCNAKDLQSVTIPKTVKIIGNYAFEGCKKLEKIDLSNSTVETIGYYAFVNCGFTSITLPKTLKDLGDTAFGNSKITSITLPSGLTEIKYDLFTNCHELTTVNLPNTITVIGRTAFWRCEKLTTINIPNSVTKIGQSIFGGCTSLKSITIPESVSYLDLTLLNDCESLETINYNAVNCTTPKNLNSNSLFGRLKSLRTINIGDKVETFPGYFLSNTPETPITVTIGKSVKSIDANFLNNITTVKTVNFNAENCASPASADAAWLKNQKVTSLKLASTVKFIPDYLAYGQSELTSVTLPLATYIGKNAFTGCSAMRDVYASYKDPVTLSTDAFDNVIYNNAILHVPTGADKYYKARAYWKNFGTIWDDNGQGGAIGGGGPDVNGDGVVDVADVTAVINAMLGK